MSGEKILLVDDEPHLVQVIRAYLEQNGYVVYAAETGSKALQLFQHLQPDLVVLDLMLPDLSGEEVCRTIRQTDHTPILMLTAKSSEDDLVNGLMTGADDYMTKPFSPRELVARIVSLLRRARVSASRERQQLHFRRRGLMIDLERHEVWLEGKAVSLTALEFKLLSTLAKHPRRVFSRLELIHLVQGDVFEGYERTIDVHIKNLRHKLGDDPKHPVFIATVFGVGYKFLEDANE